MSRIDTFAARALIQHKEAKLLCTVHQDSVLINEELGGVISVTDTYCKKYSCNKAGVNNCPMSHVKEGMQCLD